MTEGYTKEKADKLIKEHENKAKELEKQAKEERAGETFTPGAASKDTSEAAKSERAKAENLKALKKHWGD
jgi:hypothetical protein